MFRRIIACFCAALGSFMFIVPAAHADSVTVPDLTVYRRSVPENNAMNFLKQMKVGWNLGNTFDATSDGFKGDDLAIEKAWVGCYTKKEMILAVQDAGFNTIRIPVSWHNHVNEDFVINERWLARVKEVVSWAYDEGMYVILNTHHDVSSSYYYPSNECYETSEKYIRSIWTQLAEAFADYDEHLIFESMNEPRLANTDYEWNFSVSNQQCLDAMNCIIKLNQVFVDTVRAGGGYNESRYLMVPSYDASPENAVRPLFRLPDDPADNKIIVSAHAYTPYSFALQADGINTYSLSLNGNQAKEIVTFMNSLYDRYIANGIPVVIGEYGARDKKGNTQARVDFAAQYVALASARNIPCVWWDNHAFKGSGELFGILNRRNCTWPYPEIVDAIMRYAGYESLPEADS